MKHIVSVSIGSSTRDHTATIKVLGEEIVLERRGTNGDIDGAVRLIQELDGKVDALGMGGIDLYIWAGTKRFIFREAKKIAAAAQITPIVDGSGLKNTLERNVIMQLRASTPELFQDKNVLMVSAMDRFGMAEELLDAGCRCLYGDLIFALGLQLPIYSLNFLQNYIASWLAPVVVQLPFKYVYPIGKKQDHLKPNPKFARYYEWADVIAGDFHLIRKHLPCQLKNKVILTNTVTKDDVMLLEKAGVAKIITTTPEVEGRSFGTNVMEGLMVALLNKPLAEIRPQDYLELLERMEFSPRTIDFQKK